MDVNQMKAFIRNNLTDDYIIESLAQPLKDDGPHAESNRIFRHHLQEELVWRNENNKHYTEDQKTADILAHQDKIVREKAKGVEGYIPPDKHWWEDETSVKHAQQKPHPGIRRVADIRNIQPDDLIVLAQVDGSVQIWAVKDDTYLPNLESTFRMMNKKASLVTLVPKSHYQM